MIEIRGAGIAGSYLAYLLARKGYHVKVYELRGKENTKACAGGVLPRVLKIEDLKDVEGVDIKTVEVEWKNKKIIYEGSLGKSVNRRELQIYLRELAESAGAKIFYRNPHKNFSKNSIKIIASGAEERYILGIEVHSQRLKTNPEGYYFKIYNLGFPVRYAWVFPKIDGYSAGVVGDRGWVIQHHKKILEHLGARGKMVGAYLGVYDGHPRFRIKDSWVIGDAAKLVDPLNYEGYTGAFYSALYLSRNIKSPDFRPLLKYMGFERKLLRITTRHPRLAMKFIKFWLRHVYAPKL